MLASLATAAAAAAVLFSPCGTGSSCYVNASFAVGCKAAGGGVVDVSGVPNCVLRTPATQFAQCNGKSCFATGAANFTDGCGALGGFVSGSSSPQGFPAYCVAPAAVTQFTSCPDGASVCVGISNADFEAGCNALGGFVDAYLGSTWGSQPECVAAATILAACTPGGTCVLDGSFTAACTASGGFITGTADSIPVCALPGTWSSFTAPAGADMQAFAAACTGVLKGIVPSAGTCIVKAA